MPAAPAHEPRFAIEVRDLVKRFGAVAAVDGISFEVARGTVTGLLGGNGAGKTTTIGMLMGLILPDAGTIRILGHDMPGERAVLLERMNFESPYVDMPHRLTVRQNLTVFGRLYRVENLKARIAELVEDFDLAAFVDRKAGQLSAGQKTRVALAKALLNSPEVLLLDEPTASLDPDTADWVRGRLETYRAATGATILLASHNMPEVERLCDDVVILRRGRIEDRGSPSDLLRRYGRDTLEEVFLDVARGTRAEGAEPAAAQREEVEP
ncbi:ABC transporter ATP-binding protein [Pinisolibacter sp.]|mgnify:CR=1 FL=1|uniref:ABC transporter ATP-binding protein n=1 Tax=Pinisolibacter sp. TaxID=2172024 RepID=UPI002FDD49B1